MKKIIFNNASLLFTALFLLSGITSFSHPKSDTTDGNKVPVIELSGNGYQRGLLHGEKLKNKIVQVYKKWKENLYESTNQNADTLIARFYASTNFTPAIKKWTPELFNEIKGIADGSGQAYKDVFCFQLLDELWVYIDQMNHSENDHCSGMGIAATASRPAYIAQNMDLESFMNGYQVLFHIASTKSEPEQFILSCAGLIGLNGINSKSIAVCVNTLMQLKASSNGLPVAYMIRGILSKTERSSALNFVKNVPHASGQNYIIGIKDSVYDFEASSNMVVRFLPESGNTRLVYHTNHPVSNHDIKPWYKNNVDQLLAGKMANNNSYARFVNLRSRLGIVGQSLNDTDIKSTLRSKDDVTNPICRTYKQGSPVFTFSSVVMTLGKNPSIQLTDASPEQAPYVLHKFSEKK